MTELIRGTTPVVRFTFSTISVADITTAYLVIRQGGADVIKKDISGATTGTGYIQWVLTQAETLALKLGVNADICLDWLLNDGTRGVGKTMRVTVGTSAINEVLV